MVSRAFLESQKKTDQQIGELRVEIRELRDSQKDTDDRLKALIGTVDRIIRHRDNGRN